MQVLPAFAGLRVPSNSTMKGITAKISPEYYRITEWDLWDKLALLQLFYVSSYYYLSYVDFMNMATIYPQIRDCRLLPTYFTLSWSSLEICSSVLRHSVCVSRAIHSLDDSGIVDSIE